MPELPEVETIVRQLKEKLIDQTIEKVKILRPSQWKQNNPRSVIRKMKSKTIAAINRRAKFIVIDFEDECQLVIHLRMSGKLIWSDAEPGIDKFTRTIFHFKSGSSLQFNDTRALGVLIFLTKNQRDQWQSKIGIEPLGENWKIDFLKNIISNSKLDIKSFLLDQKKIAGIGNIYANEILFLSGIHPQRKSNTLTDTEIERLFKNIPDVLQRAIDNMGTSLGDGVSNFRSVYNIEGEFQNILKAYGREGDKCFQCSSSIIRIKQKGRSIYFCESCQK